VRAGLVQRIQRFETLAQALQSAAMGEADEHRGGSSTHT
jgi:hypothetical protein